MNMQCACWTALLLAFIFNTNYVQSVKNIKCKSNACIYVKEFFWQFTWAYKKGSEWEHCTTYSLIYITTGQCNCGSKLKPEVNLQRPSTISHFYYILYSRTMVFAVFFISCIYDRDDFYIKRIERQEKDFSEKSEFVWRQNIKKLTELHLRRSEHAEQP